MSGLTEIARRLIREGCLSPVDFSRRGNPLSSKQVCTESGKPIYISTYAQSAIQQGAQRYKVEEGDTDHRGSQPHDG